MKKLYGYKASDNPGKTDFRKSYLGQLVGPGVDRAQEGLQHGVAGIFQRIQFGAKSPQVAPVAPYANAATVTASPTTSPSLGLRPSTAPSASPSPVIPPAQAATPTPQPQASPGFVGANPYTNYLTQSHSSTATQQAVPPDLRAAIAVAAKKYNIPPDYLAGLAFQESSFIPRNEDTGGGGRGYFQIDKYAHPNITDAQANDPVFAADFAANLISKGLSYGGNDPLNAYRFYNGGNYKNKRLGKVKSGPDKGKSKDAVYRRDLESHLQRFDNIFKTTDFNTSD
jgi:hypothetical protein